MHASFTALVPLTFPPRRAPSRNEELEHVFALWNQPSETDTIHGSSTDSSLATTPSSERALNLNPFGVSPFGSSPPNTPSAKNESFASTPSTNFTPSQSWDNFATLPQPAGEAGRHRCPDEALVSVVLRTVLHLLEEEALDCLKQDSFTGDSYSGAESYARSVAWVKMERILRLACRKSSTASYHKNVSNTTDSFLPGTWTITPPARTLSLPDLATVRSPQQATTRALQRPPSAPICKRAHFATSTTPPIINPLPALPPYLQASPIVQPPAFLPSFQSLFLPEGAEPIIPVGPSPQRSVPTQTQCPDKHNSRRQSLITPAVSGTADALTTLQIAAGRAAAPPVPQLRVVPPLSLFASTKSQSKLE